MTLELNDTQIEQLRRLIGRELGDLSYEIAATDNAAFRAELRARRDVLEGLERALEASTA